MLITINITKNIKLLKLRYKLERKQNVKQIYTTL
jgi:hypothetical protein